MRIARFIFLILLAVLATSAAQAGLVEYVNQPDPTFAYQVVQVEEQDGAAAYTVRLTSQTWRGIPWEHWLLILRPAGIRHTDAAVLLIHGGDVNASMPSLQRGEVRALQTIASATGSVGAVLYQVPNQPLFDGLREDALISFTYERFLDGGGADWPLLFPMVKSASAAMTAIEGVMKESHGQTITRFMTTGGSKRGWTTWLSAAADPRVKRIAPMIIDMLNTPAQMRHQLATYGGYTESIADYTRRDIQDRMLAGEGEALLGQVDPFSWNEKLTLPKLVVLGTNDPYWTVDAANLYYPELVGEKHLYYQANTGHDANLQGVATITEFYNAMLNGQPFPGIDWRREADGALVVTWDKPGGRAGFWQAHSPNRDFRGAVWQRTELEGGGRVEVRPAAPESGWTACYVEVNWAGVAGMPFGLTTSMTVLPEDYPPPGIRTYDSPAATE